MAERRMVAKSITGSDSFLSLGFEARALYLHLIAEADDDGFIANPKKQMRIVGTGEAAILELCECGYVHTFPTGVCVVLHWCIHNRVRRDRYKRTVYLREFSQLKISEDGAYILRANSGDTDKNDILQEKISENIAEVDDFKPKNEVLTGFSGDFEPTKTNNAPKINAKENRAKFIDTCIKIDKETLKTRLPFPILKEYDPHWCLDYAELFSDEHERTSYRELIDFIEGYFNDKGYMSSWSNFVKYNEARCWCGVGGENVMARVCHYADEWEKRERLRRGLTVEPEDFKDTGEKTFDEYY